MPQFLTATNNQEVRDGVLSGVISDLPYMAVGPTVQVVDGIRHSLLPGRLKLWSPIFEYPGIGLKRQFLWAHADLWWRPEELDLNISCAPAVAAADLLALSIVQRDVGLLTAQVARKGIPENAADILERTCEDVGRGQKLSHYRGQIEPPASLPGGATVGCLGK
jgi:hypothetical protein